MTTAAQLKAAFLALLPQGRAWNTSLGRWPEYAAAITAQLARLRTSADLALTVEADPRTTTDLLGRWELALGLPAPGQPLASTLAARRTAVVSRLTAHAPPSKATLEGIAALFGATLTWEAAPAPPFEVGLSGAGDGIGGDEWIFIRRASQTGATDPVALQTALDAATHSYARALIV